MYQFGIELANAAAKVLFRGRVTTALEGAAPRLFRPMYAQANMGHPSREEGLVLGSNGNTDDKPKPLKTL